MTAAKEKIRVIFNPIANKGKGREAEARLRPIAAEHGQVEWFQTEYRQHAVELAEQAGAAGCRRVVAVGGDGTVHEVVNGLMRLPAETRPAVGLAPIGSGNDLSGGLGIPDDPAEALRHAFHAPLRLLDLGLLTDETGRQEYWLNTLGIGFDAVINIRSRRLNRLRGFWMYLTAALQSILLNYTTYRGHFEMDGQAWQDDLLMTVLANGRREGGGFIVAPQASLTDGVGDYIAIRRIGVPRMFLTLAHFIRGSAGRLAHARTGTFRRLKLTSESPLFIHTDGEIFTGLDSTLHRLEVEMLPGAIQVAG